MIHPQQKPIIYLITDGEANSGNFKEKKSEILQRLRAASEAGVSHIQLREKFLTARSLFELAEEAAEITRHFGTKLLVNGRADIALAAGADGVHLPADGLAVEVVRGSFPPNFVIAVSTHSPEEAVAAKTNGANFVTFGPVFESPGKGEPQGVEALNRVCRLLDPFPVVALGGIDESNYKNVVQNGASGFAAIRFFHNYRAVKDLFTNL
ncbi:MAG: thiamine phosphate synthase [Pyrinomonadaceae bacterium]